MKTNFLAATLALAGCTPLVGALIDDRHDGGTDAQPDTGNVYCEAASPCPDGYFCLYDTCEATIGRCRQVPEDCSDADAMPVCGCDGNTYSNECELHLARQSLQFVGECVSETCTSDNRTSCPGGYFCNGNCGFFDGWCEPDPEGCVGEQVCGCDQGGSYVTYNSMCDMIDGQSWFAYVGSCGGDFCLPGDPGGVCGPDEFCEGPEGACGSDSAGMCAQVPEMCDGVYDPVCGCDDQTYSSDCERQMGRVWLAHWGPCRVTGSCVADPLNLTACPGGMFCEADVGACPEAGDMATLGYCVSFEDCNAPQCPPGGGVVCGCDRKEYADDCARRQVGVNAACCGSCTDCLPSDG